MITKDYLAIRNFRHFDCSRDGIRLPYRLLDDRRFSALGDAHKAHLLCLLLLAGRLDNVVPTRPIQLSKLIAATEPVDLDVLGEFILIVPAGCLNAPKRSEIRAVSDGVRAAVFVRDGGRCRRCGSTRSLEVDHIIPASRGGSPEQDNLQTLCRSCNRRKWNKLVPRF
jgi:hypothetical protein